MSTIANSSDSKKLADAALSLKAVKKYKQDRRDRGTKRIHLYFEDVDGNWLERFEDRESIEEEEGQLSKNLCMLNNL